MLNVVSWPLANNTNTNFYFSETIYFILFLLIFAVNFSVVERSFRNGSVMWVNSLRCFCVALWWEREGEMRTNIKTWKYTTSLASVRGTIRFGINKRKCADRIHVDPAFMMSHAAEIYGMCVPSSEWDKPKKQTTERTTIIRSWSSFEVLTQYNILLFSARCFSNEFFLIWFK